MTPQHLPVYVHLPHALSILAFLDGPMSARLDYPGIGPEHSMLKDWGRAEYFSATDREALDAFQRISRLEGIIPALETSHAFAYLEVRALMSLTAHCEFLWLPNMHGDGHSAAS